jgi:hypothetical protein
VLDETAFTTTRHMACGYAPKGERLTVFEPMIIGTPPLLWAH